MQKNEKKWLFALIPWYLNKFHGTLNTINYMVQIFDHK